MSTDPDDPIVDWSSLSRIVEDFHDRGRALRLGVVVIGGVARQDGRSEVGRWREVRWHLTLSSKKSSGRSRARANIGNKSLPTPTAAWLERARMNNNQGGRGLGESESGILVLEDGFSELR